MQRDQQRRKRSHHLVAADTKRRQSRHSLLPWEVEQAKRLEKQGKPINDIAEAIGQPVRDIELALASSRSRNPDNPNAIINTDKPTKARFLAFRRPDDRSDHDVLMRVLDHAEAFQRKQKHRH